MIKLRETSSQDYKKIKELFKRNNLNIIDHKRWVSLWKKNPFLKKRRKWAKGWIMESNKKIVGHFGNFPTKYFFNNKSYICSVACGWVVDKNYRSHSILLLKKFFSQKRIDFFLNTTPTDKAAIIMNAFKAKQIPVENLTYSYFIILNIKKNLYYFLKKNFFPFKNLILNLLSFLLINLFKKKIKFWENNFSEKNIVKCTKIDSRFNLFWKKIKNSKKNILLFQRDKNWLDWHLGSFLKKNQAWIMINLKNKKIDSYAICIENNDDKNFKRAYLIDLITFDKNDSSVNLIGACINEAKKRNCDIFEFRGFNNDVLKKIKFFKPFKKKLLFNPFYYKSNNDKLGSILKKSIHWSPSYMDGDIIVNF